jgi:CopA family copper-resistance protein
VACAFEQVHKTCGTPKEAGLRSSSLDISDYLTDWTQRHAKQNHETIFRQRPGRYRTTGWTGHVARAGLGCDQPWPTERADGTEFDLYIGELPVNITGAARTAMAINGSLPGPILRWREGDTVTLRVRNRLKQDTSIHWHGIILPANMDGVPGLSFHGIAPDGMYEYKFKVHQNGTYWYHSHSGLQEQVGVYGALVIDAKEPEPFTYDRDYVVMLSDWTDEDPAGAVQAQEAVGLLQLPQAHRWRLRRRRSEMGWSAAVADRKMWAEMKMSPTDLADVSGIPTPTS